MTNRREFMTQVSTAAIASSAAARTLAEGSSHAATPARRTGSRIQSALPREETILRLGGDCQCLSITWTADDRQLINIGDSNGWPENAVDRFMTGRVFAVHGNPPDVTFKDLAGYPDLFIWDFFQGDVWPWFGNDILSVDGRIYEFVGTSTDYPINKGGKDPHEVWRGWADWGAKSAVKLIYSPDGGRTWHNQDGSTPVIWEGPEQQTRERMMFLKEKDGAFGGVRFVHMGRDYRDNRDGYIYLVSTNGNAYTNIHGDRIGGGSPSELIMMRVPKAQLPNRSAYEYFAGMNRDGSARWTKDMDSRKVMLSMPTDVLPSFGWSPSIIYNAPLDAYMMVSSYSPNLNSGAPSRAATFYLGMWIAPNPWGPWTQIHENTDWKPAGDPGSRPSRGPIIAPKWLAPDGKSFWWVWADMQPTIGIRDSNEFAMYHVHNKEEFERERFLYRQYHPYWQFNTQRVDLALA